MKTLPTELTFHRSTTADFERAAIHGGWVESWGMCCPMCGSLDAHRHWVCPTCGIVDFENSKNCMECWNMEQNIRIGRELRAAMAKVGMAFVKIGLVIVLFTLANWR